MAHANGNLAERLGIGSEAAQDVGLDFLQATAPINYAKGAAPFREALVQAVSAADREIGEAGSALVTIAAHLVRLGLIGNPEALRQIADRLDGRPAAALPSPNDAPVRALTDLTVAELEELIQTQQAALGEARKVERKGRVWNGTARDSDA